MTTTLSNPETSTARRARTMTLILNGAPLESILTSIVDSVQSQHPEILSSILLLDAEGKHLHIGAAPHLPDFYNQAIHGVAIGENKGSCGTAAFIRQRVIVENIQTDPKWADYRDLAARADLAACWSQPICNDNGPVLGTFACYRRHPGSPDEAEIAAIISAAQFAAFAIDRKQTEESLRWRTAFFEAQIESSLDGILVVDSQGRKIQQNRRVAEIFKIPAHIAASGDDNLQLAFVAGQTLNPRQFEARARYLYDHPEEISRDEIELTDGTILDRDTCPVYDRTGKYYGRIWTFRDITQRKRAEQELRASQERWSFAIEAAGDGVWDLDMATHTLDFSPRFKRMLGYDNHMPPVTFDQWKDHVHPEDLPRTMADFNAHLAGQTPAYVNEHRARCKDQSWKWILARGMVVRRDDQNQPLRVVGTYSDISDRKAMEAELRTAALIDKLTGLPNRALLLDRLQSTIAQQKRYNDCRFAVLFLDFDRFKMVNDTLGHEAGDQLLCEIARRLEITVRSVDSITRNAMGSASRLGGDEFVILLTQLHTDDDARTIAERVLRVLAAPYSICGHEIVSTVSIGIVTSEFGHDLAEDVLRDADTAMYEAKVAGKGRAAMFDQSMRTRVQRKADMEAGLRRALETNQFALYYQPIVSLTTGQLIAVEGLARWQHPVHGMISPAEFIPVAEETGLILRLGEWVFREACRQLVHWRKTLGNAAIPAISVNLSRSQLSLRNLPDEFHKIARAAGIEPSAIHLEITESAIMHDAKQAMKALQEFKALGFGIYMDDFGTGYSSLASLHQFPVDVLKIDQSFIANSSRRSDLAALVNSIVALARNLDITVIAEGVETAEQVALLQSLDCQNAQGYYFSPPLPASAIPAYLLQASAIPA